MDLNKKVRSLELKEKDIEQLSKKYEKATMEAQNLFKTDKELT